MVTPEIHFVGNGQVSNKNRRKGTYVKDLLDGVTAQEAPKNVIDDTTGDTDNE